MSLETVFSICNTLALLGWLALVLAPGWRWTSRLITSVIIPSLLALIYGYFLISGWGNGQGGFGSLEGVRLLFDNPRLLLAGWIHYLTFDLFIGSWEVRDSRKLGISHFLVIPCLLLTFLLGPLGLLTYFLLRWGVKRRAILGGTGD
jgi:hypothetical protein